MISASAQGRQAAAALCGQETASQGWALRTCRLGQKDLVPWVGGRWGMAGKAMGALLGLQRKGGDAGRALAVCPPGSRHAGQGAQPGQGQP